jgi:hypothetical protein
MSMDQDSFEAGLLIGLRAAQEAMRTNTSIDAMVDQMKDVRRQRDQEARGCRDMHRFDIYLRMPLMTAADIGWPLPPGQGPTR